MALTGRQYPITAGDLQAVAVEVGGGLRRFTAGDAPVTCHYPKEALPPKAVGAVLVPWPNRIRDGSYDFEGEHHQLPLTDPSTRTSIHGLGRWARWQPVEHTPSSVTLALDVVPQKGWPFELRAEVRYRLDAEAGLTVTAGARNLGRRRLPFGAGFHPYVSARGASLDELVVQLPAATQLVSDDAGIPTGRRPVDGTDRDLRHGRRLAGLSLDDGFTDLERVDGLVRAQVRGPAGGAQIWWDDAFPFAQVFTVPDLGTSPEHVQPGVAIEPMSCPADAFNSGDGLVVLEPDGAWEGRWGIRPLSAE